MNPRISMLDVAKQTGFSRTTVSYVLNGRSDVSIPELTRSQILQAAETLGYRPNHIARSLVSRRSRTLGVMVPSLESAFEAEIVNGIHAECDRHGYRLLLSYYRKHSGDPAGSGDEAGQARLLLEHQVEGLISLSSHLPAAEAAGWICEAAADGVACILVDQRLDAGLGLPADCVISADVAGAAFAVEHLVALGHRRIAHLAGSAAATPALDRLAGYREALSRWGLAFDPNLTGRASFNGTGVGEAMSRLFQRPNRPTALFAANDVLAGEAILWLRSNGIRVPGDVAVVGYGDLPMARYLDLTTMHQDPRELGRLAATRFFARAELSNQSELAPVVLTVPTQLVRRGSCGQALKPLLGSKISKAPELAGVRSTLGRNGHAAVSDVTLAGVNA